MKEDEKVKLQLQGKEVRSSDQSEFNLK